MMSRIVGKFYSTGANLQIFDRGAKLLQRNAAALHPREARAAEEYLKVQVGKAIADRLLDIKRKFLSILDLGSGPGYILPYIDSPSLERFYMVDMSSALLHRDADRDASIISKFRQNVVVERIAVPEESLAARVAPNSLDCVVSSLSLHWINDIQSLLRAVQGVLKPDCPFICAVLGGDTLYELRTSLQLADLERTGGIGAHVSPMLNVNDLYGLFDRAGFKLVTVDVDEVCIMYPDILKLMKDLQLMAENNATIFREKSMLSRSKIMAAQAIYSELYGEEFTDNGVSQVALPATFQIFYIIGWKSDPENQPQPLERGSASVNLKDVL